MTIHLLVFHPRLLSLAWLRSVAYFVVLYYSLWAVADLVILQFGADWGYGLRIVPNLLYDGGAHRSHRMERVSSAQ